MIYDCKKAASKWSNALDKCQQQWHLYIVILCADFFLCVCGCFGSYFCGKFTRYEKTSCFRLVFCGSGADFSWGNELEQDLEQKVTEITTPHCGNLLMDHMALIITRALILKVSDKHRLINT